MKNAPKESMPKKIFHFAYSLNFVIQAGFSMVCPAGLIILGGWLLRTKCGAGKWVMALAIILGIFIGFYSMFYYIVKSINSFDPTQSSKSGGAGNGGSSGDSGKQQR